MPIQSLSIGPITPLVANQVYALPPKKCVLYTDATTPTIAQSLTSAFTANTAVTLTAGQAEVAGGFIRATSAINVRLIEA